MRKIVSFNDDWLYLAEDVPVSTPDIAFEHVTLPHSNITLPHRNFDNIEYQFISTYRKRFRLPEALQGRRLFIDFDGALMACEVFLNGHRVGEHEGGFTPFSFDLTDYVDEKGENLLVVRLDSTERPDIPPYGFVVDYLTFGGLYRDVSLRYVPVCFIDNLFVRTFDVLTATPRIEVDVRLKNTAGLEQKLALSFFIENQAGAAIQQFDGPAVTLAPGEESVVTLSGPVTEAIDRWSLNHPALYVATVVLASGSQPISQRMSASFGFREAVFRHDGFYLNGEKIKLRGLNRHQLYPYIGAAAPERLQRKDADILRYELGCNIVRTSHYPQSPHFLNRCDEIGLLVFEEIPGWQHIGDSDWQGISLRDVEAMIVRDRNHPSIVVWGVRINESMDNEALYTATNALAHQLDPTRQTSGVRYFLGSQFLEDVYGFNDFSNTVVEPSNTPHLVTEFGGHMFPTKTWDQEERQVEHALRHARVQDRAAGMDNVTGAIGWCMFDYNTHVEFGSGDRVCYHGVMDMFRLPKFAAYVYESQIDPDVRPVLRAGTFYAPGDRSNGGADGGYDFYIFTNCDEVEVFVGESLWGRCFPDRDAFPHLRYPPLKVGEGQLWYAHRLRVPAARIVGYRNGQVVIEERLVANKLPHALLLQADDTELKADGADMTRLVFKVVDAAGHRLPQAHMIVTFEVEGPAELVGENPFPLIGGQAAAYLRTRHAIGTVTVKAHTPRLPAASVTITVR